MHLILPIFLMTSFKFFFNWQTTIFKKIHCFLRRNTIDSLHVSFFPAVAMIFSKTFLIRTKIIFYRIKIRRIWSRINYFSPSGFNYIFNSLRVMNGSIIQNNNRPGFAFNISTECWGKFVLDPQLETCRSNSTATRVCIVNTRFPDNNIRHLDNKTAVVGCS